jgi:small subunit ribosomal protein S7
VQKSVNQPGSEVRDLIVTKFMNSIMYDGKKSTAETIVYGAFDSSKRKTKQEPLAVFEQRSKTSPTIEVRSRRVGGATYQVPVEVRRAPSGAGIRWLITAARAATRRPWSSVSRRAARCVEQPW